MLAEYYLNNTISTLHIIEFILAEFKSLLHLQYNYPQFHLFSISLNSFILRQIKNFDMQVIKILASFRYQYTYYLSFILSVDLSLVINSFQTIRCKHSTKKLNSRLLETAKSKSPWKQNLRNKRTSMFSPSLQSYFLCPWEINQLSSKTVLQKKQNQMILRSVILKPCREAC